MEASARSLRAGLRRTLYRRRDRIGVLWLVCRSLWQAHGGHHSNGDLWSRGTADRLCLRFQIPVWLPPPYRRWSGWRFIQRHRPGFRICPAPGPRHAGQPHVCGLSARRGHRRATLGVGDRALRLARAYTGRNKIIKFVLGGLLPLLLAIALLFWLRESIRFLVLNGAPAAKVGEILHRISPSLEPQQSDIYICPKAAAYRRSRSATCLHRSSSGRPSCYRLPHSSRSW